MATAFQLFPGHVPIVRPDGKPTAEFIRAMNALYDRVGGAVAPTNSELAMSDDDDSGLEEFKAESAKAIDALALMAEVAALGDRLTELTKQIQDIQQGSLYGSDS